MHRSNVRAATGVAVLLGMPAISLGQVSAGVTCTITGSSDGEHLIGTAGADVICAKGGNYIVGGPGTDTYQKDPGGTVTGAENNALCVVGPPPPKFWLRDVSVASGA
jgi:Ca2+-binding RTX toxin-like protein